MAMQTEDIERIKGGDDLKILAKLALAMAILAMVVFTAFILFLWAEEASFDRANRSPFLLAPEVMPQ